jgi:hypothetical protein
MTFIQLIETTTDAGVGGRIGLLCTGYRPENSNG